MVSYNGIKALFLEAMGAYCCSCYGVSNGVESGEFGEEAGRGCAATKRATPCST